MLKTSGVENVKVSSTKRVRRALVAEEECAPRPVKSSKTKATGKLAGVTKAKKLAKTAEPKKTTKVASQPSHKRITSADTSESSNQGRATKDIRVKLGLNSKMGNIATDKASQSISAKIKQLMLATMEDGKLLNIITYQCRPGYFTDFIIIGTGTSGRHVEGAAEKVTKEIKAKVKIVPIVDKKNKEWIVIDAGSTIAHIMVDAVRLNYDIDGLMQGEMQHKIV